MDIKETERLLIVIIAGVIAFGLLFSAMSYDSKKEFNAWKRRCEGQKGMVMKRGTSWHDCFKNNEIIFID